MHLMSFTVQDAGSIGMRMEENHYWSLTECLGLEDFTFGLQHLSIVKKKETKMTGMLWVTLTKSICWRILVVKSQDINGVGIVIYQKPTSNSCYLERKTNEPPYVLPERWITFSLVCSSW